MEYYFRLNAKWKDRKTYIELGTFFVFKYWNCVSTIKFWSSPKSPMLYPIYSLHKLMLRLKNLTKKQ